MLFVLWYFTENNCITQNISYFDFTESMSWLILFILPNDRVENNSNIRRMTQVGKKLERKQKMKNAIGLGASIWVAAHCCQKMKQKVSVSDEKYQDLNNYMKALVNDL